MSGIKDEGDKKSVKSWRSEEASDNTCPVSMNFDTDSYVCAHTPSSQMDTLLRLNILALI